MQTSYAGLYITDDYVALGEVGGFLSTPKLLRYSRINYKDIEQEISSQRQNVADSNDLSEGNILDSEKDVQIDIKSESIKRVFEESGIKRKDVFVALTAEEVMVRYFEMPILPRKEWENGIRFEAKKYIPFKMEEVVSDYVVLEVDQKRNRMHIIFVAAKKDSVEELIQRLFFLGVKVNAIEMVSFSLSRVLAHQLSSDGATLLVEMESDYVTVSIVKNKIPLFTRDIPLGNRGSGIDYSGIFYKGAFSQDGVGPDVQEYEPVFESLFSEIRLSIDYYVKRFGTDDVKKIVLVGVEDINKWKEALKSEFELESEQASFSLKRFDDKNLLETEFEDNAYIAPDFLVASGLALRGYRGYANQIDLFEYEGKTHKKIVDIFPRIAVAEVVAACILLVLIQINGTKKIDEAENVLRSVRQGRSPDMLVFDVLTLNELEQKKELFYQKRDLLKTLVQRKDYMIKKINFLDDVLSKEIWITYFQTGSHPVRGNYIKVRGAAYSKDKESELKAVNQLLNTVKMHKDFKELFDEVELSEIEKARVLNVDITEFELVFWKKRGA